MVSTSTTNMADPDAHHNRSHDITILITGFKLKDKTVGFERSQVGPKNSNKNTNFHTSLSDKSLLSTRKVTIFDCSFLGQVPNTKLFMNTQIIPIKTNHIFTSYLHLNQIAANYR